MKATGIVRDVDQLGRIVIPKEIRRVLSIENGDPVEISMEGTRVVLQKHHNSCIFCSSSKDVLVFEDKNICTECMLKLKKI